MSWQQKSIILIRCQVDKSYLAQGFNTYTAWLNSLEGRGYSRSNLISIKSAGEMYLKVIKSENPEDILNCKIQDFKVLNILKKNYSTLINDSSIFSKLAKGSLVREDVENTSTKVKSVLSQLRGLSVNNKQALSLIQDLGVCLGVGK